MREYSLFLQLLAEQVYTATLKRGLRVRDASDFHEWLLEASEKAEGSFSLAEFFSHLRSDA
jgi:hypothetical protein